MHLFFMNSIKVFDRLAVGIEYSKLVLVARIWLELESGNI